jgi:hypothetical protein
MWASTSYAKRWKSTTSLLLVVRPRWSAYHFRWGIDRQIRPSFELAFDQTFISLNPASFRAARYFGNCQEGSEKATIWTNIVRLSAMRASELYARDRLS